jgi:hypothetical protein
MQAVAVVAAAAGNNVREPKRTVYARRFQSSRIVTAHDRYGDDCATVPAAPVQSASGQYSATINCRQKRAERPQAVNRVAQVRAVVHAQRV